MTESVSRLPWLDNYSGQTCQELLALKGSYRTGSIVTVFDMALNQKEYHAGIASLTQEERVIQAIEAMESEVNNGGYSQLFGNSSSEFVPILVESLVAIGCTATADLTRQAIEILNVDNLIPEAIQAKSKRLNGDERRLLDALDQKFYSLEESHELHLLAYIERNSDRIVLSGY